MASGLQVAGKTLVGILGVAISATGVALAGCAAYLFFREMEAAPVAAASAVALLLTAAMAGAVLQRLRSRRPARA